LRSVVGIPMLAIVVGAGRVMRSFVFALLLVAGLSATTRADTSSPSAFTAQFARALQAAMPSVKIRVIRDLQLDVERTDGTAASVSLANNYKDYTSDPKWFDALIKAYAAALAKPSPNKPVANLDRERIIPVIKDRAWLAQLQARFKKQSAMQQPIFDDFNSELVVVYAEDTDKTTRYLSSSEDLGVERGELKALSVDNLMRIMPRIELRQLADGAYMMTSHAEYGSSLVLVDSIWSGDQIKVNGDIVVAVPAKDVILITGSHDIENLNTTRKLAGDLAKGRYGLLDTLFVYRNGRFLKLGRD
jgi:uncharacterized protein YtpQ (UPF0354 family)